jgi:prepilin-type N-terminal cleavage/methylation domain-containing protein
VRAGRCARLAAGDERGFTMVELLVVMVILAILLAIAIPTFRSGRQTAVTKNTIVSAQTYRDAINGFKLDHSNRAPTIGAANDWPAATSLGPRQPNLSGSAVLRYMRTGAPDAVTKGMVNIAAGAPSGTAPPSAAMGTSCASHPTEPCGALTYQVSAVTGYQLAVWVRKGSAWKRLCILTDGAGGDRC